MYAYNILYIYISYIYIYIIEGKREGGGREIERGGGEGESK